MPDPTPLSAVLSSTPPRADGSRKGAGFLGLRARPDGGVSSELSMGTTDIDGTEREIPLMVPTLTEPEVAYLLAAPPGDWQHPTMKRIVVKAIDFARQRRAEGKPYFAGAAESPLRVGDSTIPQPTLAVSHGAGGDWFATSPGPPLAVSHQPTATKPTIGPAQVGDRYEPPSMGQLMTMKNPLLGLAEYVVGPGRPKSVAAKDPYGAQAFLKGAGPMPGLVVGATENISGLYSRVDRALGLIPEKGAHANKILSLLKANASGEEIAHRGVPAFLAGKGTVTRAELAAHLAAHPAPVPTVKTLGVTDAADTLAKQWETSMNATNHAWHQWQEARVMGAAPEVEAAAQARWQASNAETDQLHQAWERAAPARQQTKYSQYTVPGGEHYRETLLTLPEQAPQQLPKGYSIQPLVGDRRGAQFTLEGPDGSGYVLHASTAEQAHAGALHRLQSEGVLPKPANFRSGHFDEPNILVHTRSNERTLPTGERGRFVEEVQSDWHQQGKKQGYQQPALSDQEKQRLASLRSSVLNSTATPAERAEWQGLVNRNEATGTRVPDAPFKESWPDLGLKQQLLEAAQDPDAQWLGFTSGKTQAERYNLRKQISALYYDPKEQRLIAMGHESSGATGAVIDRDGIAPEQLADYVGKEAAQKLIDAPLQDKRFAGDLRSVHALTDTELEVGGEGMKHFYDNLLPKRLEKIVKPFGGKVERAPLGGRPKAQIDAEMDLVTASAAGQEVFTPAQQRHYDALLHERNNAVHGDHGWIVRLSPEMKAKILKTGLPLLSLYGLAQAPRLAVSHPQKGDQ